MGRPCSGHVSATPSIPRARLGALDADRPRLAAPALVIVVAGAALRRRAIVLDGSSTWAIPLGFHMARTWWLPRRGARVAEVDVLRRVGTPRDCPGATWWGAACDVGARPRLRLSRLPARGLRLFATERVAGFEIARYRARGPVLVRSHRRRGHRRKVLLTPLRAPVIP